MGEMTTDRRDDQARLRELMAAVSLTSWRSLQVVSGVSLEKIRAVRRGNLDRLTWGEIDRLARALNCSRLDFLAQFDPDIARFKADKKPDSNLQAECDRLREELHQQHHTLTAMIQANVLDRLESFLMFWPIAADRARQDATFPAVKILPLVKPIEGLLASWGVVPIGRVGELTRFDPSVHLPVSGALEMGDRVRVTHCGYWHGDRLLFRAKVVAEV